MPPPAFNAMGRIAPRTDGKDYQPGIGVTDSHNFNNIAFFVLFGIIGAAFVCGGIWFFFWARNGGFYFKESDWDEYKSTVLRRKGPNGTTLSGATESTILGGGSVYKDVADHDRDDVEGTVYTEGTALSGITGGPSDISGRERRKALREKKIKKMQEKDRQKKEEKRARKRQEMSEKEGGARRVGRDGAVVDEEAEGDAEDELRRYRHERPARVGGLNCETEGSSWDASTNPTESTVSSGLLANQQATPTNSPTKKGGIRKVYSTADKNDQRQRERERAEARAESRRRKESRAESRSRAKEDRPRREFSYTRAVDSANAESAATRGARRPAGTELSALTESTEDSERSERRERRRAERAQRAERSRGWESEAASETDLGTRSYHHPIPELRSQEAAAPRSREERQRERRRRERSQGGYRRARQDDSE